MVSRSHRFHGYNSLNWAYKKAHKISGHNLALRYIENPRRSTYRAAIVVSKKVSKSAVKRNRIRRRLYEQLRLIEDQIEGNYDLIFTVFSEELLDLPTEKLREAALTLLSKSQVIPKKPATRDIVN